MQKATHKSSGQNLFIFHHHLDFPQNRRGNFPSKKLPEMGLSCLRSRWNSTEWLLQRSKTLARTSCRAIYTWLRYSGIPPRHHSENGWTWNERKCASGCVFMLYWLVTWFHVILYLYLVKWSTSWSIFCSNVKRLNKPWTNIPYHPYMVYIYIHLRTFIIRTYQMSVNIPYMDPMGYLKGDPFYPNP